MLKTFELNEYIWRKGPYFRFYLEYNPISEEVEVPTSYTRILPWYLFGLFPQLVLFADLIFLLSLGLHQPATNLTLNWITTIGILLGNCFCLGIDLHYSNISNTKTQMSYQNDLHKTAKRLSLKHGSKIKRIQEKRSFKILTSEILEELLKIWKTKQVDKPGTMVLLTTLFLGLVPIAFPILAIRYLPLINIRFDPTYLTLVNILPKETFEAVYAVYYLYMPLSTLLLIFLFSEMARVATFILEQLLVYSYITKLILRKIKLLSGPSPKLALNEYRRLMVLQSIGRETLAVTTFMAMGIGYALLMFYAAVTITCFETIPSQVYWLFPAVTVIGTLMIAIVLPYATYCCTLSTNMIHEWKQMAIGDRSGKYRRILKTLRPVCFYFGSFRELSDETKTIYVQSLISRVVDVVLCIEST